MIIILFDDLLPWITGEFLFHKSFLAYLQKSYRDDWWFKKLNSSSLRNFATTEEGDNLRVSEWGNLEDGREYFIQLNRLLPRFINHKGLSFLPHRLFISIIIYYRGPLWYIYIYIYIYILQSFNLETMILAYLISISLKIIFLGISKS